LQVRAQEQVRAQALQKNLDMAAELALEQQMGL
jgi:hypothetical protein